MKKTISIVTLAVLMCLVACESSDSPSNDSTSGNPITNHNQGALKGKFKISDKKHVFLSCGNLQYQASTGLWRFAEEQYQIIGDTLGNTGPSPVQTAWMDLFGFGTSNASAPAYTFATSNSGGSNYPWDSSIDGSKHDWGIYNAVINGGNVVGMWRTMTRLEFDHLFSYNAKCMATVCGVCGCLLFPEDFEMFDDMESLPESNNYTTYQYNFNEWKKLEEHGAAFFPAAGRRWGTAVSNVNTQGWYWTTDAVSYGSWGAYSYSFGYDCPFGPIERYYGCSVRLIKNAD